MSHLDLATLLALREAGAEPGSAAARAHLESCVACQAEWDRLHQRVARLRALPSLRPGRDGWPAVERQWRSARRARRLRLGALAGAGLAAAAALALVVPMPHRVVPADPAASELSAVKQQSRALETALQSYNPDTRVLDGQTVGMAQMLEDRIAAVDRRLQAVETERTAPAEQHAALDLWRQRVGLLNALVTVHFTRAGNVGM